MRQEYDWSICKKNENHKMKIGIVTFQRAHNYGAVLQCFALQETIKMLGADVEVVDYYSPSINEAYWNGWPKISLKRPVRSVKNIVKSLLLGYRQHRRYNRFDTFIKNKLNISVPFNQKNLSGLNRYNALVYGSDQIWNSSITHGEEVYFGEGFDGIKVAYAASAGKDEANIKTHAYQLQQFKAIGVREGSLVKQLTPFTTKKIYVTVDPTLLFKAEDWIEALYLSKRPIQEKYVLVYPLRERNKTVEMAHKLADKTGCRLIEIGAQVTLKRPHNRLEDVGPVEFLSYICHADYVVTNSFHGTVFSIIFQKNFYTIKVNDGEDGRSVNLLKDLNLIDRMMDLGSILNPINPDYSTSQLILEQRQKESKKFLKESLNL